MAARQGIRLSAKNRNGAIYKKKYTVSQVARNIGNRQVIKYTYSKKIISTNKYRYK